MITFIITVVSKTIFAVLIIQLIKFLTKGDTKKEIEQRKKAIYFGLSENQIHSIIVRNKYKVDKIYR